MKENKIDIEENKTVFLLVNEHQRGQNLVQDKYEILRAARVRCHQTLEQRNQSKVPTHGAGYSLVYSYRNSILQTFSFMVQLKSVGKDTPTLQKI